MRDLLCHSIAIRARRVKVKTGFQGPRERRIPGKNVPNRRPARDASAQVEDAGSADLSIRVAPAVSKFISNSNRIAGIAPRISSPPPQISSAGVGAGGKFVCGAWT
jgi:hypothetical protein